MLVIHSVSLESEYGPVIARVGNWRLSAARIGDSMVQPVFDQPFTSQDSRCFALLRFDIIFTFLGTEEPKRWVNRAVKPSGPFAVVRWRSSISRRRWRLSTRRHAMAI